MKILETINAAVKGVSAGAVEKLSEKVLLPLLMTAVASGVVAYKQSTNRATDSKAINTAQLVTSGAINKDIPMSLSELKHQLEVQHTELLTLRESVLKLMLEKEIIRDLNMAKRLQLAPPSPSRTLPLMLKVRKVPSQVASLGD